MKNRILFVDDEPLVLQGLRRMLHGMRADWDMDFVEDGPHALARMDEASFDAVVTDMHMPGMDGAELLGEVARRQPQTVRLILSGHVNQDLIYRCLGTTHQCLSKPCDARTLKHTVQRTMQLTRSVKSESIRQLVTRMDRLPSMPALHTELVRKLECPDTEIDDIARIVQKDPGLTAKLLKLVNSAFFGAGRHVSNATEAVACLGMETVKSLALSIQAFSQYQAMQSGGVSFEEVWQHSLRTAEIARLIARAEGLSLRETDAAFSGGLLHDTGRIVLACNSPKEYREACQLSRDSGIPLLQAEEQVFACTHADVGGFLLGLWGLPDPVVEIIALHHTPAAAPEPGFGPLTIVHVANVLAREDRAAGPSPLHGSLDAAYLASVGVEDRIAAWRDTIASTSDPTHPV